MSRLRVVIADDHPVYRQGLASLLTASGIEVAAEAGNGWAALRAVAREAPDVAVLDLAMPGLSGAEVTRRLTACSPPHRVIILSVSADEADVDAALRAGASGYCLKDGPVEEVVAGIRAVAAGESLFSPRVGAMLLRRIREGGGAPPEPVSLRPGTARNHVSHILSKLGVDNRVQAAVRAVREDIG